MAKELKVDSFGKMFKRNTCSAHVLIFLILVSNARGDKKLFVLSDSGGVWGEWVAELRAAVALAAQNFGAEASSLVLLNFGELSPQTAASWVAANSSSVVVSLLSKGAGLDSFISAYQSLDNDSLLPTLSIYSPCPKSVKNSHKVFVYSLQMSEEARAVVLLNRVAKVGVSTLIPVLDSGSREQLKSLELYKNSGGRFSNPIFIDKPDHYSAFTQILDQASNFVGQKLEEHGGAISGKIGVLLLAEDGSKLALEVARSKKHYNLGWFSPNILEHEEWAYNQTHLDEDGDENEIFGKVENFGLYTLAYVGSNGWDNPRRRRVLRELSGNMGPSPRILSSILAYDATTLALLSSSSQLAFPFSGLSGEIGFDADGNRRDGIYFGVSSVPASLPSNSVLLLQPSTWILEDSTAAIRTLEGQTLITDHSVATSSILTASELKNLANRTGCDSHLLNLVTHDPYNQLPYNYYFKEESLPEALLIPNQHGFGVNVLCVNDKGEVSASLAVACTPGSRIDQPLACYRSQLKRRSRRSILRRYREVPEVQYQYGFGGEGDANSNWGGQKWNNDNYYYQNYFGGHSTSAPYKYPIKRLDTSVSAASEATTTPAPAPAPAPTSKLPELRQILKAAKPFVGSCIGSTTGCAMCVLVLGRLPLGAVPAACTGPCFIGTFGSCGSLLGRVFSETTIICTELFKQGLMDSETFVADAEFGAQLGAQFPNTMEGYRRLATPLVVLMQKSPLITQIVSNFALPWAAHMKFLMGRAPQPNLAGLIIHTLGSPICAFVGNFSFSPFLLLALLLAFLPLILTFQLKKLAKLAKKFK